jgi:hypothetical protein
MDGSIYKSINSQSRKLLHLNLSRDLNLNIRQDREGAAAALNDNAGSIVAGTHTLINITAEHQTCKEATDEGITCSVSVYDLVLVELGHRVLSHDTSACDNRRLVTLGEHYSAGVGARCLGHACELGSYVEEVVFPALLLGEGFSFGLVGEHEISVWEDL